MVDCGTGVTGLSASLGGGNDTFTARVPLTGAVNGGDGSDVFNAGLSAGGGTTLTYQGGAGSTDMVSYAQANVGVFIRKDAVNNDGRNAGGNIDRDKVLGDVEIVVGSRFGDTIEGDNAPETINGLGGNDRLTANGGDDRIVAQDGGSTPWCPAAPAAATSRTPTRPTSRPVARPSTGDPRGAAQGRAVAHPPPRPRPGLSPAAHVTRRHFPTPAGMNPESAFRPDPQPPLFVPLRTGERIAARRFPAPPDDIPAVARRMPSRLPTPSGLSGARLTPVAGP
nr:hypothetical protein GCM10020093_004390 [Planobispora longispora]